MPIPTERTIFLHAIDEENRDVRWAYLNSACGDDEASQLIRGTPSSLNPELDQIRAASLNLVERRRP